MPRGRPYFTNQPSPIARMDMQAATAPGRYLAQGIAQVGETIAGGIERYNEKRQEKEKKEAAYKLFEENAGMLEQQGVQVPSDPKERRRMVDAIGYEPILKLADYQQRFQAEQQKQQYVQAQMRAMQAAAASRKQEDEIAATERGALSGALQPGEDPNEDPIARYARLKGADPSSVRALIGVESARAPRSKPEVLELPGGVRGVWDGNNFSRLPGAPGSMDAPEVKETAGQKFYRGSPEDGWKPLRESSTAKPGLLDQVNEANRQAEMQKLQKQLAESQAAIAAGRGDEKTGGFPVLGWGGRTNREIASAAAMQLESLAAGHTPGALGNDNESNRMDANSVTRAEILGEYRAGRITKEEALKRAKEAGIE